MTRTSMREALERLKFGGFDDEFEYNDDYYRMHEITGDIDCDEHYNALIEATLSEDDDDFEEMLSQVQQYNLSDRAADDLAEELDRAAADFEKLARQGEPLIHIAKLALRSLSDRASAISWDVFASLEHCSAYDVVMTGEAAAMVMKGAKEGQALLVAETIAEIWDDELTLTPERLACLDENSTQVYPYILRRNSPPDDIPWSRLEAGHYDDGAIIELYDPAKPHHVDAALERMRAAKRAAAHYDDIPWMRPEAAHYDDAALERMRAAKRAAI